MVDAITELQAGAGALFWPLALCGCGIYFIVGHNGNICFALRNQRGAAERELMRRFAFANTALQSFVLIAPLLGLLGTVGGMIETFESLGNSQLFSSTGGVAGGIAQALLTTEIGLVLAVPGLIALRVFRKYEAQFPHFNSNLVPAG